MVETPNMIIQEGFVLRPASSVLLSLLVDAYHEDPQGVHSALPWMEDTKIPQQFGQILKGLAVKIICTFGQSMSLKIQSS